jgi:hypothetical protein
VVTAVGRLVAGIRSAYDVVRAVDRLALLTDAVDTALLPVAETTIVAIRIGKTFRADIMRFVAAQARARVDARLAALLRIASFRTIAELCVVAQAIVGYVLAAVGRFVAGVCGAFDAV